jgi:hypothetical protein
VHEGIVSQRQNDNQKGGMVSGRENLSKTSRGTARPSTSRLYATKNDANQGLITAQVNLSRITRKH